MTIAAARNPAAKVRCEKSNDAGPFSFSIDNRSEGLHRHIPACLWLQLWNLP
jgi:hypothetical protein